MATPEPPIGGDEPTATWYRMPARPGAHSAYQRGNDLVVEWYDFGEHAPYESANMLIFAPPAQELLAATLAEPRDASADTLARRLAAKFESYFDVRQFAEERAIPFTSETDFWP